MEFLIDRLQDLTKLCIDFISDHQIFSILYQLVPAVVSAHPDSKAELFQFRPFHLEISFKLLNQGFYKKIVLPFQIVSLIRMKRNKMFFPYSLDRDINIFYKSLIGSFGKKPVKW